MPDTERDKVLEWLDSLDGKVWTYRGERLHGLSRMELCPDSVPGFYSLRDDWAYDPVPCRENGGVHWTPGKWRMHGGPEEVL